MGDLQLEVGCVSDDRSSWGSERKQIIRYMGGQHVSFSGVDVGGPVVSWLEVRIDPARCD